VGYNDCREDGEELEGLAERAGCSETFDAYLDCVADARCQWRTHCEDRRAALEACAGQFPQ
jgi:hypothetical protein